MSALVLPVRAILDIDRECREFEDMVRFYYPVFEHDGYEVSSSLINALTHWEEMEECISAFVDDCRDIYKEAPPLLWTALQQFAKQVYYKLSLITGQTGWIPYECEYNVVTGGGLLIVLTEHKGDNNAHSHQGRRH